MKKTAAIGLKEQNGDIQKIIHGSHEFAKLVLVVGDPEAMLKMLNNEVLKMASPFEMEGLEKMAFALLINTANSSGYDGEYDIAHCLREGSEKHCVEPLVNYVSSVLIVTMPHFQHYKGYPASLPDTQQLQEMYYPHCTWHSWPADKYIPT